MNGLMLIGIGALIINIICAIIYFYSRQKILKIEKIIEASAARDKVRTKVINTAEEQIEKNKKVIAKVNISKDERDKKANKIFNTGKKDD